MDKQVLFLDGGFKNDGPRVSLEEIFKGTALGKPIVYTKEKNSSPNIVLDQIGQNCIDKERDLSKDFLDDYAYIDIDVHQGDPALNHEVLIDKAFSIGCLAAQKSNSGRGLHLIFEIPGRGNVFNSIAKINYDQAKRAYNQVYIYFINLVTPILLKDQNDDCKTFYSQIKESKTDGYRFSLADPAMKSINRRMFLTPHEWAVNADYKPFKWPTEDTHYRIQSLIGTLMGGNGQGLEDYAIKAIVKTVIPDADDHTIDDLIQHNHTQANDCLQKKQDPAKINWKNLTTDYVFNSDVEAAEAVYNRFLSLYRQDDRNKDTLYTLDGKRVSETKADLFLKKQAVKYHRPGGGISKQTTIDSIALTGSDDHIVSIFCDYSKPAGLSDKGLNIRLLCTFERETETLSEEQQAELDQFMREFDGYFRTRTDAKVKLKTGEYVDEILLLAAWFSVVCDLSKANTFRPSLLFLQGNQGSGKSTVGECVLKALLGKVGKDTSEEVTEIAKWFDDRFTPEGYEKSRGLIVREARPQGSQMPALKTEVREGTYCVEYKGQTKRKTTTQHAVLMTTNDDLVNKELLQDRSLLCIGMDKVERAPDLVFNILQNGECTYPVALSKRLKEYFDVLAHSYNGLIEAVRISDKAIQTHKVLELQENLLNNDPLYTEIFTVLKTAELALTASQICERLPKTKIVSKALVKRTAWIEAKEKGYLIEYPERFYRLEGKLIKQPFTYALSDKALEREILNDELIF